MQFSKEIIKRDQIALVKFEQSQGATQQEIADKWNLTLSFVRKHWETKPRANGVTGDDIRALQAQKMTQAEVAAQLGVSLSKVRVEWVRAEKTGRPKIDTQKIRDLIDSGKTDKEIFEATGVSIATVNRTRRNLR